MYGQGQGRQAVAVPFVASPKKPALHLLHCGPSVLCWQFWEEGKGVAQTLQGSSLPPMGGHSERDGLHEGGPLRLCGRASPIMLKLLHSSVDREASSCVLMRSSSPHMAAQHLLSADLNLPPSSNLYPLAMSALWSLFLLPLIAL